MMDYQTGNIKPFWDIEEVANLDYFYEPFNDPDTVQKWTDIYDQQFRPGLQADWRRAQPAWTHRITQDLVAQGIVLSRVGTSFYKMRPGDLLPQHQDTYAAYCAYHQVPADHVFRIIVFLQDWHPGFLFELAGRSFSHYSAGTWVGWRYNTPHMAGNLARVPRYTLQITGTLS
jgi:hypothetical protein